MVTMSEVAAMVMALPEASEGPVLAARDTVLDAWLSCAPSALADEWVRQHGPPN